MELDIDLREMKRLARSLKKYSGETVNRNIPRAMNKALRQGKTGLKRSLKVQVPELKVGAIGRRIHITKARRGKLNGIIWIGGGGIGLEYLRFKEKKGGSIYRFQRKEKLKKKAFLVKKWGKTFERVRKTRLPIKRAKEKGLAQIAQEKGLIRKGRLKLRKDFVRELKRLLRLTKIRGRF